MIRAIISALAGYVIMVVFVLLGIVVVWFSLGNRFAFVGDTNMASVGWCLCNLLGGAIAAKISGWATTKMGGDQGVLAVRILIGIVLVLGVLTLAMQFASEPKPLPAGKTIESLTFAEAGQYAVSPTWYNVAIMVVGVVGILGGHSIARRGRKV